MNKLTLIVLILPALLAACSQEDKPDSKPSKITVFAAGTAESNQLLVVDENNNPVVNAQVLIGTAQDVPFKANFLVTDANGILDVPAGWTDAEPVTIEASGFVRLTEFARDPQGATFALHHVSQVPNFELTGTTNNLPIKNNDGNIDFGLVMSALTRTDLMSFDIGKIISTQTDQISAAGQSANVPSNLCLPKQTESYLFFPVTINKPDYRLYFANTGHAKVFAARGRIPFSLLTSGIGSKPVYDLANSLSITGGSVHDVNLVDGAKSQDFSMTDLNFSATIPFTAPAVSSTQVVIGLAAADIDGYLIPTDIKHVESNQTLKLAVHPTAPSMAVGVLKNANEFTGDAGVDRVSAVILPFGTGVKPQFISLIANPAYDGALALKLPKPADIGGVNELATLSILSQIEEVQMGNSTVPFLLHQWEVYAPAWVDHMNLPQWPGANLPRAAKNRWEVTYLGSQLKNQVELGQAVIDAATHITHSSVDF